MKKILLMMSLGCLLLITVGCKFDQVEANEASTTISSSPENETIKKSAIPTIFIHGYSGGKASFGHLIGRMEDSNLANKEMTITVNADGSLNPQGKLSHTENNPMIQVLFVDNTNTEWAQTDWIREVLLYLKNEQGINEVNLVGHSMGGVSSLRYLCTYGQEADLPKVVKFAAIGAPFNDFTDTLDSQTLEELIENGPSVASARYQDYQNLISNIPTDIPMTIMAGQLSSNEFTDGTVSVTSALSVYQLLQVSGFNVSYSIISKDAQHSQLHENQEVDQLLKDFLWL
ncbi:MAG TPA: alpha/beta hydrolase [Candidatus Tetragenococcus pullicola]|nr:alpha/beta hydrolase [Candidatus Tetragenococcus pullicola]